MRNLVLIMIGGGFGSLFRFLLSKISYNYFGAAFPYGTFIVNVIGSFLIGLLSIILLERMGNAAEELRALLIIGLLGGFTTFSSFSLEAVGLLENRELIKMGLYLFLTVAACLVAAWGGLVLGRKT